MTDYCPQGSKIHIIIVLSLVFTCLLTSCSVIGHQEENQSLVDDSLFGTGVFVNIASGLFSIYLLKIDMFDSCKIYGKFKKGLTSNSTEINKQVAINKCNNMKGCKWSDMSPFNIDNGCKTTYNSYIYLLLFIICSAYLLAFGIIIIINKNYDSEEHFDEITRLSIAAIIGGSIGILLTLVDLLLCVRLS